MKDYNIEKYVGDAIKTENYDFEEIKKRMSNEHVIRLLHAGMGLTTEAGEFVDQLKKHIFYGKELDLVNLEEELGDDLWYVAIAVSALKSTLNNIMGKNIEKLKKRYPEGFTEKEANNRNLVEEREILEK